MVTDEKAERALHFLIDSASEAAEALAQRYLLEEGRKSIKAEIMRRHLDLPVSAQEREAYASPEYKMHLEGTSAAIGKHEKLKMQRVAAEATIELWRSQSANIRGKL